MNDIGLLDLGNSRYKWTTRIALDAGAAALAKHPYAAIDPVAELAARLRQVPVMRWAIASVKGREFDTGLAAALADLEPVFVRIPTPPALPLAYREPRQFGIDRYLNLLGTVARYAPPLIVIDAGTAVTFDALDHNGVHLGGCIFPGLNLLGASLAQGTRLVQTDPSAVPTLFARSTAAGVNGGTEAGWLEACHGITRRMTQALGPEKVSLIWTGGDAARLHLGSDASSQVDSRLLFHGLRASLESHHA